MSFLRKQESNVRPYMKKHHFIYPITLQIGMQVIENTKIVHQIYSVLKMQAGEKIVLCNGAGYESEAVILETSKKQIRVDIKSVLKSPEQTDRNVVLYCAILKRENFELVVQKATEIAVNAIVPMLTHRTVKTKINESRMAKIIEEAVEQSERSVVPKLGEPMLFGEALRNARAKGDVLFFDISGEAKCEIETSPGRTISVFIGPEGGWTDEEVQLAKDAGCKIVSLGKTILRAETAAIISSYLAIKPT